jgi:hypothetical protein
MGLTDMDTRPLEDVVRNIDAGLGHVEQVLPTLATNTERRKVPGDPLTPLATEENVRLAVEALATREEVPRTAVALATKEALRQVVVELTVQIEEDGERTRHHLDVIADALRADIRLLAEGHAALQARGEAMRAELKSDVVQLSRRVTRLEHERLPPRRR